MAQIALTYPDTDYTSANKPSNDTLKADLSTIETGYNAHDADTTLHFLASTLYPVGSIYINAGVSTNPATLLGFGTWTAFAPGKVIIGIDTGDTDYDSLADTGGAKTATLGTTNMAAHTHTGTTGNVSADHSHTFTGTSSGQSATHHHNSNYSGGGTDIYLTSTGNFGDTITNTCPTGDASGDHTHTYSGTTSGISANHTHAFTTGNGSGSGTAFSIMNPYVTAYCWKRVS